MFKTLKLLKKRIAKSKRNYRKYMLEMYEYMIQQYLLKNMGIEITEDMLFDFIKELTDNFNRRLLEFKKKKRYERKKISIEFKELNYVIRNLLKK